MSDFQGQRESTVKCAAILAGGLSSRMGREKALIEIEGQTLVARTATLLRPLFPNLCVVTSSAEVQQSAGVPAIADQITKRGPLGGIHAVLSHFQAPTFIVACDMPFLRGDFIRFLVEQWIGLDALLPESEDGLAPLHAIYAPSCLSAFDRYLPMEKPPSMRRILTELRVQTIGVEVVREFDSKLRLFENWNSPEDISAHSSGDSS